MSMSKLDFVSAVSEKSGLNKEESAAAVDAFLATVEETLVAGDSVSFAGFGTFEVRNRASRMMRNPQTGETRETEASKMPAFRPGETLKVAVNK